MIRIVFARRLQRLELEAEGARADRALLQQQLSHERTLRLLAEQARDFHAAECAKWERRASKFIDQVGIADGKMTTPAMSEAAPPASSPMQGVMAALSRRELHQTVTEPVPTTAPILGVDERAASEAIHGLLHTT
jgi:hypothetical protein